MFNLRSNIITIYFLSLGFCIWDLVNGSKINSLGVIFISLTLFLTLACLLVSLRSINHNINLFLFLLSIQNVILIGVFIIENILFFYLLFEATLIPIFLLIIGWGSREEKIRAGYYLFFFTLISSLLMLLSIIKLYLITGTLNIKNLSQIYIPFTTQKWIFICFAVAMGVKVPMFPFHIWLPQAHVEAPLVGSVLLAGILLKLGAYGFIVFTLPVLPMGFYYFSPIFQWISLLGIILGGLSTLRQSDMKRLIAYSSVAHMGFATFSLFNIESEIGIIGCVLILIAHGIVSPALFIIVGILYDRYGTRIIKYYKGVSCIMPILTVYAFLFTLCSVAFPCSLNFVGEVLIIISATKISLYHALIISIGAFIGLKYSLYLYGRIFTGELSLYLKRGRDLTKVEYTCLIFLFIPVIFFGIFPWFILNLF